MSNKVIAVKNAAQNARQGAIFLQQEVFSSGGNFIDAIGRVAVLPAIDGIGLIPAILEKKYNFIITN